MPPRMSSPCECGACCSYPNGSHIILSTILIILSFGLTLFSIYGCHFVNVDLSQATDLRLPTERSLGFGLYTREHSIDFDELESEWQDWDNYACYEWKNSERDLLFDSKWKAARAMGQISAIVGFILMVLLFVMACMSFSALAVRFMAAAAFLASLTILLTLVAFASDICDDFQCSFSHSAGTSIAAGVLFLISACVLVTTPSAKVDDTDTTMFAPPANSNAIAVPGTIQPPAGTVITSETVNPDGSKTIVKTTYNSDGSKTVQERAERPNSISFGNLEEYP